MYLLHILFIADFIADHMPGTWISALIRAFDLPFWEKRICVSLQHNHENYSKKDVLPFGYTRAAVVDHQAKATKVLLSLLKIVKYI